MKNPLPTAIALAACSLFLTLSAQAVPVTVSGAAGPWDVSLNPSYDYGFGQLQSTVVNSVSGVDFTAGNQLTITSLTPGQRTLLADAGDSIYSDANGVWWFWGPVSDGTPGKYIPGTHFVEELLGTFAYDGVIVGNPFSIGNGPTTVIIPENANQLLMGVNDDNYTDNGGSVTVDVSVSAWAPVPEAAPTIWLLGISVGGMALLRGLNRPRTGRV
ncbi:MAG: hypothetical protein P4N60_04565 [Verrucomicrobiae bacterium]|nr:hypothetical protein [Verrucomicrobiae bacterium]